MDDRYSGPFVKIAEGLKELAAQSNLTDGEWHDFSLSFRRDGDGLEITSPVLLRHASSVTVDPKSDALPPLHPSE